MPESVQNHKVFSLLEITQSIQRAFQQWYSGAYWIKAEMNKLNFYKYSGHCYPDLVERQDGKVVAQIRGTLWSDDFNRINNNFLSILKEPLKDGINILFLAKVSFSPVHGISLMILDIDPAYTLGDLEREKLETIKRLKQEDIFDQNKLLPLAPLPQRIAIISVETSKGYADFKKIIKGNTWGYKYFLMLFPALLQGDKAPESIMGQLSRIKRVIRHFDAVAIVRGGGGEVGLSSYNNYQLARTITTFPIPVLTGIGHSTNETVAEMVAHTNAITPTELADYLIQKFHNLAVPLNDASRKISGLSQSIMHSEWKRLIEEVRYFRSVTSYAIMRNRELVMSTTRQTAQHAKTSLKEQKGHLNSLFNELLKLPSIYIIRAVNELDQEVFLLNKNMDAFLKSTEGELSSLEKQLSLLHPENVLKRGYSITLLNGKSVTSTKNIVQGDIIETILHQGNLKSKIIKTSNTEDHE
ncbi:MAG: exodeoxyribonuclease VII large subunit [Bacteroidales bacterium]|nr:exodeoxyribonuclease VII large subunit [Bacteroidales bacterium]